MIGGAWKPLRLSQLRRWKKSSAVALLVGIATAGLIASGFSSAGLNSSQSDQSTVFATISAFEPDGKALRFERLLFGFRTIARNMDLPEGIQCGPEGRVYVAESAARQIIRMNQNGSSATVVADGSSSQTAGPGYAPSFFTFASNGDLIFTTRAVSGQAFTGLWRLPQGDSPSEAVQLLNASAFGSGVDGLRNPVFLQSGPFAGDMLLEAETRVVRIPAPDFAEVKTFISAESQGMEELAGITLGPEGDVYVTDFRNRRILKYAPDGTFEEQIAEFNAGFPNQVAFDASGTMYVTATVFGGQDTGALHIIEPNGRHRVVGGQKGILGLAVCQ